MQQTILNRLKKMLRIQDGIKKPLGAQTKLGGAPLGFDDIFIDSNLRHRINRWFDDLVDPFPSGQWREGTTLAGVAKDITDSISRIDDYRGFLADLINAELDEAGAPPNEIPEETRLAVAALLNVTLQRWLIRDVDDDDLAGNRDAVVANLLGRMLS